MGAEGEGILDRRLERLDGGVTAVGDVLVFDLAPDGFNQVQLRTVGRDEEEAHASTLEGRDSLSDHVAVRTE